MIHQSDNHINQSHQSILQCLHVLLYSDLLVGVPNDRNTAGTVRVLDWSHWFHKSNSVAGCWLNWFHWVTSPTGPLVSLVMLGQWSIGFTVSLVHWCWWSLVQLVNWFHWITCPTGSTGSLVSLVHWFTSVVVEGFSAVIVCVQVRVYDGRSRGTLRVVHTFLGSQVRT